MQFGVCIPHYGLEQRREGVVELVQRVEEMGYDSVWVSDHVILPVKPSTPYPYSHLGGGLPSADSPWLEPLTTLAFLAGVTRGVKLGTSVCVLPYRNPVMNAKVLASIDVLSGGRLILGVGSGWLREEAAALGVPFDRRGKRTAEHIQVLKALWTMEEPEFKGEFYSVADIRCEPKPVQKPHPPVWVGGHEPAALRRAGVLGDGWHAYRLTPGELASRWQTVQAAAREAGRDPSRLVLSLRTGLSITDEPQPPGRSLVGPRDQILNGLREYQGVGVSHILFDVSLRHGMETLQRFAEEVLPEFR